MLLWPQKPFSQARPCGQSVKICLLGSLPKPGASGQLGPKWQRRFAPYASQSLTLLFLLSARLRVAQQIVDVGLDRRDLLHIRLGLAVLGVELLFSLGQLAALLFECVYLGELAAVQNALEVSTGRPVKLNIRLMFRKKFSAVLAGLVLLKDRPGLGILHRCRLQFHVGMEGRFGAFDLVGQLVKTLCGRRGLLLQLLIVRQAVVLQVGKGGGHLFEIKQLGPPLIAGAFPLELGLNINSQAEDLRIQKLRNRNIFELSGGEKQKIAFASVYAMNPQIYLLDEPSSNLDMTSIQELKEHLRLIKKQGKTILIAEHRLYYLTELADRIVYLEKGEIKEIYTPEEFRQLPEPDREHMGLRAVDLQAVFPPKAHLPAPTPVLELRNVTLRYKKQTILHDIGLSAGKGEVIGVVGHNGAGKTTFSRALCGLHKDCDGQFLWERKPIERKARLKRSYMVMQDVNYELFADSVEAECSFGIRNPDQTLVNATLEELGLTPYRERHPNTLSGGQKQRVAVAVSMICGKDLLVFDEPTSGLDFDSMTQVAGLIRRLSDMGKVIFIVTHDFEFVCRTCSRVLHFDEGEMPDDVSVVMEALPKLRELFSVSDGKER